MSVQLAFSTTKDMNPHNDDDRENKIQRREKELQERERAIRLRELEAEIYGRDKNRDVPFYQTQKNEPTENSLKRGLKKLKKWSKFLGFVVVGFGVVYVGIQVGIWLTYALIVSVIGFIGYKLFLEKDNSNSK
jgi:hypothetical protein